MRRAGWALAGLAAVVAVVLAVPLGAGMLGIAQLVAFRAGIAVASGAAALVVVALSLLLPRPARTAAVPLLVVLVLSGVAQVGVLVARSTAAEPEARGEESVVVLSFNTLGRAQPRTLAALVRQEGADVVVLPETSAATATATAALLADEGIAMQVRTAPSVDPFVDGVALLVSPAVGRYSDAEILPMRHGALSVTGDGPTLVAVHPVSPSSVGSMPTWRTETRAAADACASRPGAIVAGDFNATLDHPAMQHLGPCVDAADAVGRSTSGTWPASAPTWLATPIDHVLVDGRTWRVLDFDVLPATGGSDHRPVVATLERR
ncbi:endonuclease/exonuclease/phosphatase family protein [Cellulomonas sp. PhB150]|uniref:endonuclease/exonuclease/phosphatase family protein n=1 Tax=Cellulomonas sp. PhB150 TaxID=2485188 RepID=UPI000FB1129D|nr:endonuclease/exonuclease/phosphatase family protein [Cellulomonas sp. PhB150]ROS30957.1 endonuclease/exonuclease/phosphatase (EEP) superfamily protein YafD [Cellulomonas sp. PhB150]